MLLLTAFVLDSKPLEKRRDAAQTLAMMSLKDRFRHTVGEQFFCCTGRNHRLKTGVSGTLHLKVSL